MREHRTIPLARQGEMVNCPMAPSEHASVYAKCMHRACLIVGGIELLSNRLQVPKEVLERWIRGEGEPPPSIFHAAVEIILLYVARAGPAV